VDLDGDFLAIVIAAADRSGDEFRRARSIVTVGLMIARSASPRGEPRRPLRSDFPNHDDIKWRKHVVDRLTILGLKQSPES